MKWKSILILLMATAIGVTTVSAQTCELLSGALEALAAKCTAMVRGDLCHEGQLTSFEGITNFTVDTLALGETQASYPDVAMGRFVSMAFIGGLEVQPIVETAAEALPERVPVYVVVTGIQANVRGVPRTGTTPVAKLDDSTSLNATGITKSGTWVRVILPDQPMQAAWINKSLLGSDYDMGALPVVAADDPLPQYPEFTPMQAFSISAGSPCAGVVLQSGDDPARLQINGIVLDLNEATAFVQNTGDRLTIQVLEGIVQVEAQDVTTTAVAGALVQVPLDAEACAERNAGSAIALRADRAGCVQWELSATADRCRSRCESQAIEDALVTPLSGRWQIDYPPPYDYKSSRRRKLRRIEDETAQPDFRDHDFGRWQQLIDVQ